MKCEARGNNRAYKIRISERPTNLEVTVAGGVVHDEGEVPLALSQLLELGAELAQAPLRLLRGGVAVRAPSPLSKRESE